MAFKIAAQNSIKRFAWLAAIWVISVLALGVFAMIFRLLMSMAGLTT